MADKFTPEKRSEIMSLIRGKNTKPETIVFKYLRQQGIYFKRHYDKVIGNPDIALPRKKKAVFIDGDFWHGRTFERRKDSLPAYWVAKIIRNIKRDRLYRRQLRTEGWTILQVWEGDIITKRHQVKTLESIRSFLVGA